MGGKIIQKECDVSTTSTPTALELLTRVYEGSRAISGEGIPRGPRATDLSPVLPRRYVSNKNKEKPEVEKSSA